MTSYCRATGGAIAAFRFGSAISEYANQLFSVPDE
jgi:hypothetical protein